MNRPALLAFATALIAAPALAQVTEHPLPAEISYPEGIAHDRGAIYTMGAADGVLARTNLATGQSTILQPAGVIVPAGTTAFPAALGMKIDASGRLFIAGGRTGKMYVYDVNSGKLLRTFDTAAGGLVNDVILINGAAIFTDTLHPKLWRVPLNGQTLGELETWIDLKGGPIPYGEGASLNGIAATPDGSTLIVGQMGKGLLFRIDVATKAITPIDLDGQLVTGVDGLVLTGNTLYVVSQTQEEVITVELSADYRSGKVLNRFKDPAIRWPATAALHGDRLLVVNAQFNKRNANEAVKPFSVISIPRASLAGR
jgi:sugar lactone lactonase YvrE